MWMCKSAGQIKISGVLLPWTNSIICTPLFTHKERKRTRRRKQWKWAAALCHSCPPVSALSFDDWAPLFPLKNHPKSSHPLHHCRAVFRTPRVHVYVRVNLCHFVVGSACEHLHVCESRCEAQFYKDSLSLRFCICDRLRNSPKKGSTNKLLPPCSVTCLTGIAPSPLGRTKQILRKMHSKKTWWSSI